MNMQGPGVPTPESAGSHTAGDAESLGQMIRSIGMLGQVFRSRSREILAPTGMTFTQMMLMTHLERFEEGQTISELAAAIDVQQPGVSKVVAHLEDSGDVLTERSAEGRRVTRVRLSDEGVARLADVRARLTPEVQAWFNGWSAEQLDSFASGAASLARVIDERRGAGGEGGGG